MGTRSVIAGVLIVAGLALGVVGYRKSELTTGERVAGGFAGLAEALDPTQNPELKRAAGDLLRADFRRAMPYYGGGGAALLAAFALLLPAGKTGRLG